MKRVIPGGFLLVVALLVMWTPDTERHDMQLKYGAAPSRYLPMSGEERIHYRDQGPRTAPVLVLIHGTGASLHTWEPLIAQLQSRFRLISLDLPGHGLTGANAHRDYSYSRMSAAVWAVLDHLNIASATLVGNSLGGSLAWQSALAQPQRVHSLVLLAPAGIPHTEPPESNLGFRLLGSL